MEEREVEIIEGAIAYTDRPYYVHIKFSVNQTGESTCRRTLIDKNEFRRLLNEYKWVQASRKVLGGSWPYMIRQCDDDFSLKQAPAKR